MTRFEIYILLQLHYNTVTKRNKIDKNDIRIWWLPSQIPRKNKDGWIFEKQKILQFKKKQENCFQYILPISDM